MELFSQQNRETRSRWGYCGYCVVFCAFAIFGLAGVVVPIVGGVLSIVLAYMPIVALVVHKCGPEILRRQRAWAAMQAMQATPGVMTFVFTEHARGVSHGGRGS